VEGHVEWTIGDIGMVLPVRIELTTSPLPRGCSTTELRQHRFRRTRPCGDATNAPATARRSLPQGGNWRNHLAMTGSDPRNAKNAKQNRVERPSGALRDNLRRRKTQAKGRKAEAGRQGSDQGSDQEFGKKPRP